MSTKHPSLAQQTTRGVEYGLNSVLHDENASIATHSSKSQDTAQEDRKPPLDARIPTLPSLQMPKGGGAIQGIGEKITVNPSNGTCSLAVPIRVSSGRSGIQPTLSLVYDSGSGNSPFGLGWNLKGVDAITRKTSKGLPRYSNLQGEDSDVFILSGMEDLVPVHKKNDAGQPVPDKHGRPKVEERTVDDFIVRRYLPRIVESHLRIERWTKRDDLFDVHWRITSTDNVVTLFGSSPSSRIYDHVHLDTPRVFSWLVSESWDPQGNAMIYTYKNDDSVDVPVHHANETNRSPEERNSQMYPKKIQYGNTIPNRDLESWKPFSAFDLDANVWNFSVVFDYGEHDQANPQPTDDGKWSCRADPFSEYRSGFEIRTYRLCRRVLMFHHFKELPETDYLVLSTDLSYGENASYTHLSSVEQAGYVWGAGLTPTRRSLPPIEFKYTRFPDDEGLRKLTVQDIEPEAAQNLPVGTNGSSYRWLDLDGEGISGVLSTHEGAWYYKRNLTLPATPPDSDDEPDVSPSAALRLGPVEVVKSGSFHPFSSGGMSFADVNGNGKLDVVSHDPLAWGYFERDTQTPAGWSEFHAFPKFPKGIPAGRGMQLIDLTGDGLADVLVFEDQVFNWYELQGDDGYAHGGNFTQPNDESHGPQCVFADTEQTYHLADMSGDGLGDLVRITNDACCYWPNLGYGKFGKQVCFDNVPCFDRDDNFSTARLRLVDVDGSGPNDLLYFRDGVVDVYLNQAGNSFSSAKFISFPQMDQSSSLDIVDLLGTGTPCIVWSSSLPGSIGVPLRYLNICGRRKPHLLSKIINNVGSETYFSYASSTQYYIEDKLAGKPWITSLPFPVHCVKSMEVVDRITGNRFKTDYRYKHGYYDCFEREFRGFARVDQVDSTVFSAKKTAPATNNQPEWHVPPVRITTWFHTGAYVDRRNISQALADEYFNAGQGEASEPGGKLSPLSDSILPMECVEGSQQSEAFRSLKGKIIRIETYGLDGTLAKDVPYSVQQANFSFIALQPWQNQHSHGIYQVHSREAIAIQYDRSVRDPRVNHILTLETDIYGNAKKELTVAYGRLRPEEALEPHIKDVQKRSLILFRETDYTDPLLGEDYRTPLPYDVHQYEVTGLHPASETARLNFETLQRNSFETILSLPAVPYEAETQPGVPSRRLLRREHILYRKDDLTGFCPTGKIEPLVLPGAMYEMAFTPGLLSKIYTKKVDSVQVGLMSSPNTILGSTSDTGAGYVDLEGDGHWWKSTGQISYASATDANPSAELVEARRTFFTPKAFRDTFGNVSQVEYDDHRLFPVVVTDAVGNTTRSTIDYRVLQPSLMIDANGNTVVARYDALGMLAGTAIMGKPSDNVGDTVEKLEPDITAEELETFFNEPSQDACARVLGDATTRVVYDLWRWKTNKEPIFSAVLSRDQHVNHPIPLGGTHTQVNFTYSDGFGRIIQSKVRATPGPREDGGEMLNNRWIGTGWTVYNNKGHPVKTFEPFFDGSHRFQGSMLVGVSPTLLYDPAGRNIATLRPDHGISKAVYTPWSEVVYDSNDTVSLSDARTDPDVGYLFKSLPESDFIPSWYDARIGGQLGSADQDAASKTAAHANTPKTSYFDPLGRPVHIVDQNGGEKIAASVELDIQGNATSNKDPLKRTTLVAHYDMCMRRIHTASMDAGEAWILHDALDKVLLKWNSRDFRFRTVSDALRRPTQFLVQESNQAEILYQENVYGELAPNNQEHNLRGVVWKVRDQAGAVVLDNVDFKGNPTATTRYLHANYKDILDLSEDNELVPKGFITSSTFDALGRPVQSVAPDGTITHRIYDETANISGVYVNTKGELDPNSDPRAWTAIVLGFDYNAKGQVVNTKHGNGTTTFRTYDRLLDRLSRLRTVRESGDVLQDLTYTYDAVGNVTNVKDDAQQVIFFRNNKVDPSSSYTYDAAYRLIQATGREHVGQTGGRPVAPGAMDDTHVGYTPLSADNAMARYIETYRYDVAGNILSLRHASSDDQSSGWTRTYTYEESGGLDASVLGNRLSFTTIGSTRETYRYDGLAGRTGNMTSMSALPIMQWDYAEQLRASSRQIVNNGGIPEMTYYVYDSHGTRIRKVTESQSGGSSNPQPVRLKDRIYLGDYEIFRKYGPNGTDISVERTTFHAGVDASARIERRTQGTDERVPSQIRFQLTNLLGSVCIEADDTGQVLSYEEYFPYGSTSYQATANQTDVAKRYRYTNKELDSENGLYYYGTRYYSPWMARWTSCDPVAGPRNAYDFVSNNPIHLVDPDGNAPKKGGASFENRSGSSIHAILTVVLRTRLAQMGVHSVSNVETRVGGNKEDPHNAKGWGKTGKIDIAPLARTMRGDYQAHVYEFRFAVPTLKKAYDKASESQLYARYYPLGPKDGLNVTSATVGTMLEDLEKIRPGLVEAPITYSNAFVELELKMKLPADEMKKGKKVAGLITYTLSWKRKTTQGDEQEQVLEALKELREQVQNTGVPAVPHVPPPIVIPAPNITEPAQPKRPPQQTPQQPQTQPQQPQQQPDKVKPDVTDIPLGGSPANDNGTKEEEGEKNKAARDAAGVGIFGGILIILLYIMFKGAPMPSPAGVPVGPGGGGNTAFLGPGPADRDIRSRLLMT